MSADGERSGREVAYRLFAAEYDDATLSHAESDEERAPNYVITPTGARVNRLFAVGTLTEVSSVNEEMVRARVVDPTGAFVVYAGQYQPDALAFLERADPPAFVAVTGKARTFQPDDSDRVYTSVRPESIETVDADTRDRWVVATAEQTLDRIATYAGAAELDARDDALTAALEENGVSEGLARGIPLAQDHYGTTPDYLDGLRSLSLDAVRVVANEQDEVVRFDLGPSDAGTESASFADLAETEFEEPADATPADSPGEPAEADRSATATADAGGTASGDSTGETESIAAGSEPDATDSEAETTEPEADEPVADSAEPKVESAETEAEPAETEDEAASGATDAVEADETATSFDESDVDETEGGEGGDESGSDESGSDDLGDFESGDLGDDMYEMDEEEREEIEEEFGTEFTTGSEVDEPGEADIDAPEPDESAEAESETAEEAESETTDSDDALAESSPDESEADAAESAESEAETGGEGAVEGEASDEADESAEDIDLQDYVVDAMDELDDGDGADRGAVIETVVEETGASAEDVEEAIQDALMGGQCYEPDDETLKAI